MPEGQKPRASARGSSLLIFPLVFLFACEDVMVNYDEFLEKPSAIRKGNMVEINLGITRASANWVAASSRINDDTIYIYGKLTFKEIPQTFLIELPDPKKDYHIFWVDKDGKKTEIKTLSK